MQTITQTLGDERQRRGEVERAGQAAALKTYVAALIELATERGDPARTFDAAIAAGVDALQAERDLETVREAVGLQEIAADLTRRENEMNRVTLECEHDEEALKLELAKVRQRRAAAVTAFREAHQSTLSLDRLQNQRPELFETGRAVLLGGGAASPKKPGSKNLFVKLKK